MSRDFSEYRREYLHATLSEQDVDADPIRQFDAWFSAVAAAGYDLPNAMFLATSSGNGVPSVRTVLLKDFDHRGFVFYSHADSPKGVQLQDNPRAALLFYWAGLDRQIRIDGTVSRVSDAEADEYFNSRPYDSRLGAWVAPQSSVIEGRAFLDQRMHELELHYRGREVPRPEEWVGYRVYPEAIEFWQGRESRLHDRIRYRREADGGWRVERLAP